MGIKFGPPRLGHVSRARVTQIMNLNLLAPDLQEDILRVLDAWGNKGGPEDLDGSGTVDFADLLIVLAAWGPCE